MIQINKIPQPLVEIFDNNGKSIGHITSYCELLDLQCQIAEANADGYSYVYEGKKYFFNADGECSFYPPGMYDDDQRLIAKHIRIIRKKRLNLNNDTDQ